MKKSVLMFIISLITTFCAFSQSAEFIDKMLSTSEASYTSACYISAVTQGFINEKATFEEAYNALYEKGQISKKVSEETKLAYKDAAELFARMWNIKGGLMFRATKGSARYAFKQMKSDGVIAQNQDPDKILSGLELLNFYTKGTNIYLPEEQSSFENQ